MKKKEELQPDVYEFLGTIEHVPTAWSDSEKNEIYWQWRDCRGYQIIGGCLKKFRDKLVVGKKYVVKWDEDGYVCALKKAPKITKED